MPISNYITFSLLYLLTSQQQCPSGIKSTTNSINSNRKIPSLFTPSTKLLSLSLLSEVSLNCVLSNSTALGMIILCRWYNRTETSLNQIEGVTGSYYQPSLRDIGSIIHIQCMPELEGVEYEGMPIIKDIGPIKVDPQTQQQGNDLMQAKKATFFIKIKQIKMKQQRNQHIHEGLIKITNNNMRILSRFNEQEQQIINKQMTQNEPQLQCNRLSAKELTIYPSHNHHNQQYVIIQFSNNKVRDVLCLLNKFIVNNIGNGNTIQESSQSKTQQHINTNNTKNGSDNKQSSNHSQKQKQRQQQGQTMKEKQKQKEVKSSQELMIKKVISTSPKQNASELMEISQLKKQLRKIQNENYQLNKTINDKNQTIQELQGKLSEAKERQTNINRNYFELQERLNSKEDAQGKIAQEMSFYQNEYRMLKQQSQANQRKIKQLTLGNIELQQKLQPYVHTQTTYSQLKKLLQAQVDKNREYVDRYEYIKSENVKMEEKYNDMKELINELQNEKKSYHRKYESITNQLMHQQQIPIINNLTNSRSSFIKEKSVKSESQGKNDDREEKMQREILQLKKQLKEIVQENNHLRSLNIKEKKSTSKAQLKAQLIELRKLANRLAQTVTEKDLALQHMKKVNKQLSERMLQLSKFQCETQQ